MGEHISIDTHVTGNYYCYISDGKFMRVLNNFLRICHFFHIFLSNCNKGIKNLLSYPAAEFKLILESTFLNKRNKGIAEEFLKYILSRNVVKLGYVNWLRDYRLGYF